MVIWLIGLSGSGKTTLGREIVNRARNEGQKVVFIDGDHIRTVFGNDLGHSLADRKRNADRICALCRFLDDQDIHVVCAILSIFHESQAWNRRHIARYHEVFIDAPMKLLARIDYKGLYARSERGEISDVVGVDIPFYPPPHPDRIISNDGPLSELLGHADELAALMMPAGDPS